MIERKPRGVQCSGDPALHGSTWTGINTFMAQCEACTVLDNLASRSSPATEEQVRVIAGGLARHVLEVLLAEGSIKAVVLKWGFRATKPTPPPVPQPPRLTPQEAAELQALQNRFAPTTRSRAPVRPAPPPPPPKPAPEPPPPPLPSWERMELVPIVEPEPVPEPKPLNPRDDGYWDEVVDGVSRRAAWSQRTAAQRAAQREARNVATAERRIRHEDA